jgi:hypothetical protein
LLTPVGVATDQQKAAQMPGHDEQGIADPPPADRAHAGHDTRRGKRGEARVPPAVAVLLAIALYAVLPEPLLIGPRFLIPGLELALLVALIATNPWRMTRQTRWSRRASLALAILVVTSNLATLTLLVVDLVSDQDTPGTSLLIAALQVWATNVIAFALIYWELDRGGPVARTQKPRHELPLADLRFTQDETQDTVIEVAAGSSKKADWIPTFVDYFYLSTTNQRVQPHRHHAPDQPHQVPHGHSGHRRAHHLAAGHRPRRRRPRRRLNIPRVSVKTLSGTAGSSLRQDVSIPRGCAARLGTWPACLAHSNYSRDG